MVGKSERSIAQPQGEISVIIPTRNRPEGFERCLAALSIQTFGRGRFEVIVVDDGRGHSLASTTRPFCQHLRLQLVEQVHAGPARARNVGAELATGSLLVFTDDDCEPEPDWLAVCHEQFNQRPDRALGGHPAICRCRESAPWSEPQRN